MNLQHAFRNAGIFRKILFATFPVLLIAFGVWMGAFLYLTHKSDRLSLVLKASNALWIEIQEIGDERNLFLIDDAHRLRFYETGFAEHADDLAKQVEQLRKLINDLDQIEGRPDPESSQLIRQLEDFQNTFDKLVQAHKKRGLTTGGIDQERNRVLDLLAQEGRKQGDSGFAFDLLQLIRDHGNFRFTESQSFLDSAQATLKQMNTRLRKYPGKLGAKIQSDLRDYATNFDQFVSVSDEISDLRSALDSKFEALESSIIAIAEKADRDSAAARRQLGYVTMLIALIILLGEGAVIYFLAKSISIPIEALSHAVTTFEADQKALPVSYDSTDEIGILTRAFSQMVGNLDRTQRQLLQAQKLEAIGTLAGGIAHDFNNLLGGILAYSGILKKRLSADPSSIRDLSIIEQSAQRGAELTRQLLGYARKGAYERKRFEINSVISEARKILYRTIDKSIVVKADLGRDLEMIDGDPGQILQVLMNIGINARDAMPDGGELLFESQIFMLDETLAKTQGIPAGRYVRVSISDTGVGIPKEIQSKIFEPFFTTKEVGKGTGLGLSMVYGIMQNHHGAVTVYSEPGRGTRFNLYFPAVSGGPETRAKVSESDRRKSSDRLLGKMILVVDDETLMLSLAKDTLEPEGATVFLASNGEDAVAFLEKNHTLLSAVVLDVIMPKMDGIKLFRELRKIQPEMPVIFASGYAESETIATLRRDGRVDFIQKPYRPDDLIDLIMRSVAT